MSVTTTEHTGAVALARTQAMHAAAQGRLDDARKLLESALVQGGKPDLEVLADLAAIALRAGDLVQAIGIARHVVAHNASDDAARFTLAMGLAAIGSNVEALSLLESLNHGVTGQRFHQATPELAALAATEAARLRSITTPLGAPHKVDAPAPAGGHKYDLSHLTQPLDQNIGGPIQDDEAMLLYAVVRTMRVRRVLEIGGLSGYSARNFLRALSWDVDTAVYTVDLNPVKSQAPNHYTICKDVSKLEAEELHGKPLDLVFFDCHVFDAQMGMFVRLVNKGLITDETIIALHDTNLHPRKSAPWSYPIRDADGVCGYVHQDVERKMVNTLRKDFGYDVFCAHTDVRRNDERLPFRHGVTLMKKFVELKT